MPCLSIQTNVELPETTQKALLSELSKTVAAQLGKPEQYMLVTIAPRQPMLFAGADAPAAFLSLQSIGLPETKLGALCASICESVTKHTTIPGGRTYIVFSDVKAKHWGFDGSTFG